MFHSRVRKSYGCDIFNQNLIKNLKLFDRHGKPFCNQLSYLEHMSGKNTNFLGWAGNVFSKKSKFNDHL